MITDKERKALNRAIKRLVKAEIENSWKGSQAPEDHFAIWEELDSARTAMARALSRLQRPMTKVKLV